jgi:hypothetical protein
VGVVGCYLFLRSAWYIDADKAKVDAFIASGVETPDAPQSFSGLAVQVTVGTNLLYYNNDGTKRIRLSDVLLLCHFKNKLMSKSVKMLKVVTTMLPTMFCLWN